MHRSAPWKLSSSVGAALVAVLAVHWGGASSGLGLAADAGLDASSGAQLGLADVSTCHAAGAGCHVDIDCCGGSCVAIVCGGSSAVDGASGSPGQTSCSAAGTGCARGFECCSGTCNGSVCVGSMAGSPGGGTAGAVCLAPTVACTQGPQCCSGLCEPVTGQAGVIQCRDACRANGVACATAQDCCSLGCFGGVCTAKLCAIVGDGCAANADCCSGVCNASKRCDVDLANSRCRPTGEDCGKGPQSGCCGATDKNDLCDQNGRCGLPPGACRGQKASCASDTDCCSKHCDPGTRTCVTPCVATSGTCAVGADCCASSCTSSRCDAPAPTPQPTPGLDSGGGGGAGAPAPTCATIGTACTSGPSCCSGLCLAGFCDQPIF